MIRLQAFISEKMAELHESSDPTHKVVAARLFPKFPSFAVMAEILSFAGYRQEAAWFLTNLSR